MDNENKLDEQYIKHKEFKRIVRNISGMSLDAYGKIPDALTTMQMGKLFAPDSKDNQRIIALCLNKIESIKKPIWNGCFFTKSELDRLTEVAKKLNLDVPDIVVVPTNQCRLIFINGLPK